MSAPWETLLDWWFGTSSDAAEVVAQRNGLWFGKNVCQDADAGGRFGDLVNQALDGGLQEWTAEADGWLALILLLDQLPRMIYRDTPRAYAGDARAQRVVREGLEKGFDRQAAFGFCFGGCCALELARDGAELKAFVSFHGTLDTPDPAHARNIKGAVLVLDGASDPLVPREQLPAFAREMTDAGVDWQLTSYGGAVHSFTDPNAKLPGKMHYDARTSRRAFQAMDDLLAEVFA